ncbi:MAG: hypothetical protein PHI06_09460 [Desulfobulbaceae bacterium]|nr:hypothetical protein [Desulfobulbaceae bacterium]
MCTELVLSETLLFVRRYPVIASRTQENVPSGFASITFFHATGNVSLDGDSFPY